MHRILSHEKHVIECTGFLRDLHEIKIHREVIWYSGLLNIFYTD